MDFYIKKYVNTKLRPSTINQIKELSSGVYAVGSVWKNEQSPSRIIPSLLKLDNSGNVLWEKGFDFEDPAQVNIIRFQDIYELSDGKLLLFAHDERVAWVIKTENTGEFIWKKKLYDAKDTPHTEKLAVYFTLTSFDNDFYTLVLRESHYYNSGNTFKTDYKFLTFNGNSGEIVLSKKYDQQGNFALSINDIQSGSGGIYLIGRLYPKSLFFSLDTNLNIKDSFTLSSDQSIASSDGWKLSNLYQNQLVVAGNHNSKEKNYHFISKIDLTTKKVIKSILLKQNFLQTYFSLTQEQEAIYFSKKHELYKLNTDLEIQWGKYIENSYKIMQVYPDKIYSQDWSKTNYPDATFLLSKTDKEYNSCLTQHLNIPACDDLNLKLDPYTISLEEYTPSIYSDPVVWQTIDITGTTTEDLCPPNKGTQIEIDENSPLQSSSLYVQAAGSQGKDSTQGIHLRWLLKGTFENHLPKGNYSETTSKKNDFISLYRALYVPKKTILDFSTPPTYTESGKGIWIYKIEDKKIYVKFHNLTKYKKVSQSLDPFKNPWEFIQNYGEELISIETKKDLFFAVQLTSSTTSGKIKLETLSVENNTINAPNFVSFRKEISQADISQKILEENIRSVRFIPTDTHVSKISLEFYDDFIQDVNNDSSWKMIRNDFSLTLEDSIAYERLESQPGIVHGKWLRYNHNAYTNIENYKEKWKCEKEFEGLKYGVEKYLKLSEKDALAIESISTNEGETDEEGNSLENTTEISYLTLLQLASLDYHNARMLGLGHLDLSPEVMTDEQYVYAITYNEKTDSLPSKKHIYLSLPTSLSDQRLPQSVSLQNPVPGILTQSPGSNEKEEYDTTFSSSLKNGYSPDGNNRYISLFLKEEKEDPINPPFYYSTEEKDTSTFTYPVYIGLEYKMNKEQQWRKPELLHDPEFHNIDTSVSSDLEKCESIVVTVPDEKELLFVHTQKTSGKHWYNSYGVNWFNRSVESNDPVCIETNLTLVNSLLPPYNSNALLIKKENSLLLTSEEEQKRLHEIQSKDKTLVRLTFDFDSYQDEVSYQKKVNGDIVSNFYPLKVDEEVFAEEIEIFYRPEIPNQIIGKIQSVSPHPLNSILSVVKTEKLTYASNGEEFIPYISPDTINNYKGSVFIVGNSEFIIDEVFPSQNTEEGITLHIIKNHVSNSPVNTDNFVIDETELLSPKEGEAFLIIENMQNMSSWGEVNPHSFKITLGNNWNIFEEEITVPTEEGTETFLRRFRGINDVATIEKILKEDGEEDGLYKISFNQYILSQHPQYSSITGQDSVEWHKGYIRIPYESDPEGERKKLKVIQTENIDNSQKLIVYAIDESFSEDENYKKLQKNKARSNVTVNYYPGYKVYLYQKASCNLTEDYIYCPEDMANEKYSIFCLRSKEKKQLFHSLLGVPSLLYAQKDKEPQIPDTPKGGQYTTRPDYFGKASYTFTSKFKHEPYGLIFCRANIENLLASLYTFDTVNSIKIQNSDNFATNRWEDFVNFSHITSEGYFYIYNNFCFPLPDNPKFYDSINLFIQEHNDFISKYYPAISKVKSVDVDKPLPLHTVIIPENLSAGIEQLTLIDFAKQTLENCYTPLTEHPIVYKHIKGPEYKPVNKTQKIRDKNGYLLNPIDPEFDIAPMMKRIGSNETSFTDFTIDGAADTLYFYGIREINLQLQQSAMSSILGPVKTVNAYAPPAPQIKKILSILEEPVLGIKPSIQLEINAYPTDQKIKKIHLYRALDSLNATSIRTMELIKTLDIEDIVCDDKTIWTIYDTFEDLENIPFLEPLYYKVIVSSEIEYEDLYNNEIKIDYVPSDPSELIIANIADNVQPQSPKLSYNSQPIDENGIVKSIIFNWGKTVHNGIYHLYQLTSKGNWEHIYQISTNVSSISLPLEEIEKFNNSNQLICRNSENNPIYYHFKIIAENSSGIYSKEEKILTIYLDTSEKEDGIGYMIIEDNFIIYGDDQGIGQVIIEDNFKIYEDDER